MFNRRVRMAAGATVAALAVSFTGLAGTSSAQTPEDLAIVVQNAPVALSALAKGVENALDAYTSTQSIEQAFLAAAGDGGPTHGTSTGIRGAIVDLFWGISLEPPFGRDGSALGYVAAGATDAYWANLGYVVSSLDDPERLIAGLTDDPAWIPCRDRVAGSFSFPCEVMSVAQLQAILDRLADPVAGNLTEAELACVANGLRDGFVPAACLASQAFQNIGNLFSQAYRFTGPNGLPYTPLFGMASTHVAMATVLQTLIGSLVPDELNAAFGDLMDALAPVTVPLADALDGIEIG